MLHLSGWEFTVCLVAHRLQTVIDYDRVVVLDNGQVSTILVTCWVLV